MTVVSYEVPVMIVLLLIMLWFAYYMGVKDEQLHHRKEGAHPQAIRDLAYFSCLSERVDRLE